MRAARALCIQQQRLLTQRTAQPTPHAVAPDSAPRDVTHQFMQPQAARGRIVA